MAELATPEFLDELKAIYLAEAGADVKGVPPWYMVATAAFSSSGVAAAVPIVFKYALDDLKKTYDGEELLMHSRTLASKLREGLLASCVLCGLPRVIESLVALHSATPEELRSGQDILRDKTKTLSDLEEIGRRNFQAVYGSSANAVRGLMESAYPDLAWFCATVAYGISYDAGVLTPAELSYGTVAVLISTDAPRQTQWHLANARNVGAPVGEIKAVREIAMKVALRAGIKWKEPVPEVV
ncbi:hypothetical protein WOLCODRAFT_136369 [Wolfiporia cocos MD-104 SS10]|uniref:Carboxymuconolactone decarboxylase-like domain-containing protein n=1 Tax=Wolfiporia cocos (strain MD-104) TaxID=742152 RepID=A0A2H3J8T3_WOLCO|nr:hypothetical protein WOLCODRAFT_136369 [Wolfiporia cocos MD-104 SS10]